MSQVAASADVTLPYRPHEGTLKAGDYEFCPHIVQALKKKSPDSHEQVILLRRRDRFSLSDWEAVPLDDFGLHPLDRLLNAYDPEQEARHPTNDEEHRELLHYYGFVILINKEHEDRAV